MGTHQNDSKTSTEHAPEPPAGEAPGFNWRMVLGLTAMILVAILLGLLVG